VTVGSECVGMDFQFMDMQPTDPDEAEGFAQAIELGIYWLWQRLKSLCNRIFRGS